jgi:RimJ/RimL family protein N-acetyltransferase
MAHTTPLPDTPYHRAGSTRGLVIAPPFRPTIETQRLVLRPLSDSDADDIVTIIGDVGVARMLARVPHPYGRENADSFIRFAANGAAARRSLISAITLRGRLIGVVSIDDIRGRNRLGYWLGREVWGRGYGTEAVSALVAYAFTVLGLRQIRAGVFVDNRASLRVLIRLGFRPIRRIASRSLARGETVDHIATVLTRARFQGTIR